MHEREFFDERPETKTATYSCPKCRFRGDYQVRWIRRTRKSRLPRGAGERDRAMFDKLRNYLVRVDDMVVCQKCRRRFDIPSHQSLAFFSHSGLCPEPPAAASGDPIAPRRGRRAAPCAAWG